MSKSCVYKAKKGDVFINEGHKVLFLRQQTLRDVYVGEFLYGDAEGKEKYCVIDNGKGVSRVSLIGINENTGKIDEMKFPKNGKFWRIRGVCFADYEDTKNVCDLEIREDRDDDGGYVYDVYEQLDGDSEFLEAFCDRKSAEQFADDYRVRKWVEKGCNHKLKHRYVV